MFYNVTFVKNCWIQKQIFYQRSYAIKKNLATNVV